VKSAFTLIELLVVIAIIAILAAILFPVFAQAKLAAKKASAISNSKQSALASLMYINDYDDTFLFIDAYWVPNQNNSYRQISYYENVNPYVKSADLAGSPASYINNKNVYGFTSCNPSAGALTNYNISMRPNGAIIPNAGENFNGGTVTGTSVIVPANTILMIDSTTSKNAYISYDYHNEMIQGTSLHPANQVLKNATFSDNQCGGYTRNTTQVTGLDSATAYTGLTVFTFVDGHAKPLKFAQACFFPGVNASTGVGQDNMFGGLSSPDGTLSSWPTGAFTVGLVNQTYIPALNADNR
jgi:prepilin-type N-terminal cleavage/methylation domain-containing protein